MSQAISKLIYTNRIAKTSKIFDVLNPLSVTVQKVAKWLIINLPHANKHIFKEGKYNIWWLDIYVTSCRIRTIFLKFDIKQGHQSIEVHSKFTKYIAFCWERDVYVILVLPFGLSSAPYTFTKMKRCIVKQLRSLVVRIACFLRINMMAGAPLNQQHSFQNKYKST